MIAGLVRLYRNIFHRRTAISHFYGISCSLRFDAAFESDYRELPKTLYGRVVPSADNAIYASIDALAALITALHMGDTSFANAISNAGRAEILKSRMTMRNRMTLFTKFFQLMGQMTEDYLQIAEGGLGGADPVYRYLLHQLTTFNLRILPRCMAIS